jgi:hypothetical protein
MKKKFKIVIKICLVLTNSIYKLPLSYTKRLVLDWTGSTRNERIEIMNFGSTLILAIFFVVSCAKTSDSSDSTKGTAYAKDNLSSLQSCQFHADCSNNQECAVLMYSAGVNIRCC